MLFAVLYFFKDETTTANLVSYQEKLDSKF